MNLGWGLPHFLNNTRGLWISSGIRERGALASGTNSTDVSVHTSLCHAS
jgi:hypothetical protein